MALKISQDVAKWISLIPSWNNMHDSNLSFTISPWLMKILKKRKILPPEWKKFTVQLITMIEENLRWVDMVMWNYSYFWWWVQTAKGCCSGQARQALNWLLFGFLSTFLLSSLLLLLSLAHSFVHSSVLECLRHDLTLWWLTWIVSTLSGQHQS